MDVFEWHIQVLRSRRFSASVCYASDCNYMYIQLGSKGGQLVQEIHIVVAFSVALFLSYVFVIDLIRVLLGYTKRDMNLKTLDLNPGEGLVDIIL